MKLTRTVLLASLDALPTEFRLFAFGANETTKGTFTLTPESAAACMATYATQGVDVMVDLNHDSLNNTARAARADAGDARGWFKLELRDDGLWAVDVRWTPDGAERLRSKKQRYISPAFMSDDAGVIFEIVNAALVAMPATHGAPALVAASAAPLARHQVRATSATTRMDPAQLKAALDAIEGGDAAKALEILKALIASAAAGGAAPTAESSALEGNAEEPPVEDDQAALAALRALTGAPTALEAVARFRSTLETVQTLAADRAAVDLAERQALIAELVTLGVEFPATAWADADKRTPAKRLADEPIADLRARVALHRAQGPRRSPAPPANPNAPKALSASEQAACKRLGITPDEFNARKAGAVRTAGKK